MAACRRWRSIRSTEIVGFFKYLVFILAQAVLYQPVFHIGQLSRGSSGENCPISKGNEFKICFLYTVYTVYIHRVEVKHS